MNDLNKTKFCFHGLLVKFLMQQQLAVCNILDLGFLSVSFILGFRPPFDESRVVCGAQLRLHSPINAEHEACQAASPTLHLKK